MKNWHRKGCRPDIMDAGSIPFCSNCDSDPSQMLAATPPDVPKAAARPAESANLDLYWPSRIAYTSQDTPRYQLPQNPGPTHGSLPGSAPAPSTVSGLGSHADTVGQNYGYESLRANLQIRVLRLDGGSFESPLHGDLVVVNVSDAAYEALSYTWGDEEGDDSKTGLMYIGPAWDFLPVTKNCELALRRLRRHVGSRTLWVDAVCIDQTNVLERNHQVSLMTNIYSNASCCVIYLGEHSDDSPIAMECLETLNRVANRGGIKELSETNMLGVASQVAQLFSRRYFSRLWIIQEVVLSPKVLVQCGDSATNWHNFALVDWSRHSALPVPPWISYFHWTGAPQRLDLHELLYASSSSLTSDARDKIFGLLGLLPEDVRAQLPADYNLNTAQVYIGIAAFLLCARQKLWLLKLSSRARSPNLPSWVPDWERLRPDDWVQSGTVMSRDFPRYGGNIQNTRQQLGERDSKRTLTIESSLFNSGLTPAFHVDRLTGRLHLQPEKMMSLQGFVKSQKHNIWIKHTPRSAVTWLFESYSETPILYRDYLLFVRGLEVALRVRAADEQSTFRLVDYGTLTLRMKYPPSFFNNLYGQWHKERDSIFNQEPIPHLALAEAWFKCPGAQGLWSTYYHSTQRSWIRVIQGCRSDMSRIVDEQKKLENSYGKLTPAEISMFRGHPRDILDPLSEFQTLRRAMDYWADRKTWALWKRLRDLPNFGDCRRSYQLAIQWLALKETYFYDNTFDWLAHLNIEGNEQQQQSGSRDNLAPTHNQATPHESTLSRKYHTAWAQVESIQTETLQLWWRLHPLSPPPPPLLEPQTVKDQKSLRQGLDDLRRGMDELITAALAALEGRFLSLLPPDSDEPAPSASEASPALVRIYAASAYMDDGSTYAQESAYDDLRAMLLNDKRSTTGDGRIMLI